MHMCKLVKIQCCLHSDLPDELEKLSVRDDTAISFFKENQTCAMQSLANLNYNEKIITTFLLGVDRFVKLRIYGCVRVHQIVVVSSWDRCLCFCVIMMSPFLNLCTTSNLVVAKSWHQTPESSNSRYTPSQANSRASFMALCLPTNNQLALRFEVLRIQNFS